MPNYKLHYFNATARADLIRLLFAYSGIDFEDHRISLEEWPALKPTTPLGTVPYLEVDNVKLVCSVPCARFVAAEGNLLGRNHLERAQADGIVDLTADLVSWYYDDIIFHTSDEQKPEAFKKFWSGAALTTAKNFEKLIGWYGSNGHSVGPHVSWADIALFNVNPILKQLPNFKTEFPKTADVIDRVAENIRIQNYLKSRPALMI